MRAGGDLLELLPAIARTIAEKTEALVASEQLQSQKDAEIARKQADLQAVEKNLLAKRVRLANRILDQTPAPLVDLLALPMDELRRLAETLEAKIPDGDI